MHPARLKLQEYFHEGQFNDLFIQIFVETNGKFNYKFFNKFHETKFSYTELFMAIEDMTGSRVIPYREIPGNPNTFWFDLFTKAYEYGKFEDARYWVYDFWYQTDFVPGRVAILNWIAKQHPPKQHCAFLPAGNLQYDRKEEKSSTGTNGVIGESA